MQAYLPDGKSALDCVLRVIFSYLAAVILAAWYVGYPAPPPGWH